MFGGLPAIDSPGLYTVRSPCSRLKFKVPSYYGQLEHGQKTDRQFFKAGRDLPAFLESTYTLLNDTSSSTGLLVKLNSSLLLAGHADPWLFYMLITSRKQKQRRR